MGRCNDARSPGGGVSDDARDKERKGGRIGLEVKSGGVEVERLDRGRHDHLHHRHKSSTSPQEHVHQSYCKNDSRHAEADQTQEPERRARVGNASLERERAGDLVLNRRYSSPSLTKASEPGHARRSSKRERDDGDGHRTSIRAMHGEPNPQHSDQDVDAHGHILMQQPGKGPSSEGDGGECRHGAASRKGEGAATVRPNHREERLDCSPHKGKGSRGSREATTAGSEGNHSMTDSSKHAVIGVKDTSKGAVGDPGIGSSGGDGAGKKHAPKHRRLLSFEEEEEEVNGDSNGAGRGNFSMSASTANRFQQERSSRPAAHIGDSSLSSWTPGRLASALGAAPVAASASGSGCAGWSAEAGTGVRPCNGMKLGSNTDDDMPRSASARGHGKVLGHMVFGVASARNVRPYMEDRHTIVQSLRPLSITGQPINDGVERSFASVYDGHNGSRSAEMAASRLHMAFAADPALRAHTGCLGPPAMQAAEEEAISAALRRAFRDIDDLILENARADGGRDGATALVVARLGDTLYSAWAGDSRAVISRDGVAERLTEDHKPQMPLERSRVEANGGRVEFQRCWRVIVEPREGRPGSGLAVSRSLGDLDFKEPRRFVESEPEVKRVVPRPGDSFVVLASDGLWDVLSDQESVDCVGAVLKGCDGWETGNLTSMDAKLAAETLLDLSLKRGTVDNVTVVLMLLHWV